jgi:hypothetical protein
MAMLELPHATVYRMNGGRSGIDAAECEDEADDLRMCGDGGGWTGNE